MKIAQIRLQNFKRFTDLVVRDVPLSARLVVVVGPNGCGKSSLFDGLLHWYRAGVGFGYQGDDLYYRKADAGVFDRNGAVQVSLHDGATPQKGSLYIRTAYRNDPDFKITGIVRSDSPSDGIRVARAIETDQTVSDNYQRLVYDTMAGVYDTANDAKSVQGLREELIGQIRASMRRVFGDLVLKNVSDPLGAGAFFFEKGTAKTYHYKNLSGGEKAAFDLLLDLHVKKKFYDNAVYCIDEVETHLHTRVQGVLLKELVNILPAQSQLWVTTHSLGVLRAAQEMAIAAPGSVSLIDFDGVDPDVPQVIVPSSLGRVSWEKVLSLALDDLSQRIAPKVVVVCEGSAIGSRRRNFDAEIYNRVLGSHAADVIFVSGGSSSQLASTGVSVRETLAKIAPVSKVVALSDRDDKSSAEVAVWEARGDVVLTERNLESYLFADDVIEALLVREGKVDLLVDAMKVKSQAIANSVSRGNPSDDLKSASGEIHTGLRRLLDLRQCGDNTDAFMRDTLAPLITPDLPTYSSLKAAVIDRVV